MKKFVLIFLVLISLFSSLAAQSGRKVQAVPATSPAVDDADDYSESKPQPKRPVYLSPSLHGNPSSVTAKNDSNLPQLKTDSTTADEEEVVKVDTSLITIPVSVFDRNGLYIPGLRQSDFKIYEDGKEQQIAYFGTSDKPFTVILLIDTSPSTAYKIEEIRAAATAFVDQLKTQDKVMVIEFARRVTVLTEATGDRQKIYKAINRADFGVSTSLYDAVNFSLNQRLNKVDGRKAIVLFTDGVDTNSTKANYDTTIGLAEESDTLIFPIYYNTFFENNDPLSTQFPYPGSSVRGTSPADYALGKKYLEDLASYSGGRVFRPEATPGGLTAAFEGIAEELRRQYNIGYIPVEDGKPGQRKHIKVRVNRPNLVLRSRDSYIVGTQPKAAT